MIAPLSLANVGFVGSLTTAPAYDADAQALLTAAGIVPATTYYSGTAYENTGQVIGDAVNTFTLAVKAAGSAWSKLPALYPLIGGTATAHALNLKTVRAGANQYGLLYTGGLTHSATGLVGNGSTGEVNTQLDPSVLFTLDSFSMGFFAQAAVTDSDTPGMGVMGNAPNSSQNILLSINRGGTSRALFTCTSTGALAQATYGTAQKGLFIGNRTTRSSAQIIQNGTQVALNTNTDGGTWPPTGQTIRLFRVLTGYSVIPCAGAFIGSGLTAAEMTGLANAFIALNTTLKRY